MDPFSQIAFGVLIAEVGFRRQLGKRALLFGALCVLIPDIDALFHDSKSLTSWTSHQGLTHSMVTLPAFAPVLGGVGWSWTKWISKRESRLRDWIHLAFWSVMIHPLLDLTTAYGAMIFYPLSDERYATDAIAGYDPFFLSPLLLVALWAAFDNGRTNTARFLSWFALVFSALYLGFAHLVSQSAVAQARAHFSQIGFAPKRIRATPFPMFPLLRRVVALDERGNVIMANYAMEMERPPNPYKKYGYDHDIDIIKQALDSEPGQIIQLISDGFYYVDISHDQLRISDARQGLITEPWASPYAISAPIQENNKLGILLFESPQKNKNSSKEFREGWKLMKGQ